jgi:hypothetical protein
MKTSIIAGVIATILSGSVFADSAISTSVSDVAVSSGIGFVAGSNWVGGSIQSASASAQNVSNATSYSHNGLYLVPAVAGTSASTIGSTSATTFSSTFGAGNVVVDGGTYAGAHQAGHADADALATNYKLVGNWCRIVPVAQGTAEAHSNADTATTSFAETGLNGFATQGTLVDAVNTSHASFSKLGGYTASSANSVGGDVALGGGFALGNAAGYSDGYLTQDGSAIAH